MNFELTDEQAELRDAARRLAQERFKDKSARWDRDEEFPEENKHLLAELGYLQEDGLLLTIAMAAAQLRPRSPARKRLICMAFPRFRSMNGRARR